MTTTIKTIINSSSLWWLAASSAGCVSGELAIPARSAAAPFAAAAGNDDPVPLPMGPVTLEELVRFARASAPGSLLAEASTFGAQAELEAAQQRALYNPVVQVSLGARSQAGSTGLEAQVGVSQQIEVGGERNRRISAAEQGAREAESGREARLWVVEVEVRRLYRLVTVSEDLVKLSTQAASAADSLAAATQEKVEAGEEPPLVAELSHARAALLTAKVRETTALRDAVLGQLAAASGWPGDPPLVLHADNDHPVAPPDTTTLVHRALQQNRDRTTLEAGISRAAAERRLAKREAWPEPAIGVNYAREAGVANSRAANVVLGTLSVPIPSFSRNQASRARARAAERSSEAALLAFERGVPGKVAAAAARVRGALERIDALDEVASLRDGRQLVALNEAFDAGEVELLEVLQTLEQVIEARTALLEAKVEYINAAAALELVVGGDFGPEEDTP